VGALGHHLEGEGIATTGISLIREHTVKVRPPRALWVPFELGRPFGPPRRAAIRRRVLLAALNLLEAPGAPPLLVDDAGEAPATPGGTDALPPWTPPSLAPPPDTLDPAILRRAAEDEIAALRPRYVRSVGRRGRTTVGALGLSPAESVDFLAGFFDGVPGASPRPDLDVATALKIACEEARAYLTESAIADLAPWSGPAIEDWVFQATATGRLIDALRRRLLGGPDPAIVAVAKGSMMPGVQVRRAEALRPG